MLVAAEVMALVSVWRMAPLLCPPAVVVIFTQNPDTRQKEDVRKARRGRRRRRRRKDEPLGAATVQVQWNATMPFDLCCQTPQNALCLQFQCSWACRQGALGLAALAVTLLSPRKCLLPLRAEGKLEGRHPDRQTGEPQAVEIAVTSHRKSLLTGMLHRSDTTKWAFTDPNTQGEKCGVNRRPGGGWELK